MSNSEASKPIKRGLHILTFLSLYGIKGIPWTEILVMLVKLIIKKQQVQFPQRIARLVQSHQYVLNKETF